MPPGLFLPSVPDTLGSGAFTLAPGYLLCNELDNKLLKKKMKRSLRTLSCLFYIAIAMKPGMLPITSPSGKDSVTERNMVADSFFFSEYI